MIRGQRVRRVVRSIDTWSVLRVAVLFYLSLMLVIVLAGVMLWVAGSVFGAVDGMESFMAGIGFDGFEFVGGQLLRGFTALGLVLVVLGTGATVLAAILYNLIADVVGGIQLSVLEEVYVPEEGQAEVVVDADGGTWLVPATEPAADAVPTPEEDAAAAEVPAADAVRIDAPEPEPARAEVEPSPEPARAEVEPVEEPEPLPVEPVPAETAVVEPEPEPAVVPEPASADTDPQPRAEPDERAPTHADAHGDDRRPEDGRPASPNGWSTPSWSQAGTAASGPAEAGTTGSSNG